MAALWQLTATEMVNRLRTGEVTPLEAIDAMEQRINQTDGAVNATPIRCFARARTKARELAARGHPTNPPPGYLYGLPILLKDLGQSVKGVRGTNGTLSRRDHVDRDTGRFAARVEAMGGLVCGKTNVPEFGAGSHTFNPVFGATASPHDVRVSAGGSSGGAAAALAAGQTWLATGSDLGGSLRIPASFNGIVGFRTTPGRVLREPAVRSGAFATMHSVQGPMARNVADCALLLDTLRGSSGWDFDEPVPPIGSALPQYASFQAAARSGVAPRRVAYSKDLGLGPDLCPTDPGVAAMCERAAQWFVDQVGSARHFGHPDLRLAYEAFHVQRAYAFTKYPGGLRAKKPEAWATIKPEARWNARIGFAWKASGGGAKLKQAVAAHERLLAGVKAWFADTRVDVLVTPAVICPPFDVNVRYLSRYGNTDFESYLGWMVLSWVVTVMQCPAIVVPCGTTPEGLPVGIQLIARPGDDGLLLSAARLYEQAHEHHRVVPVPRPRAGSEPIARAHGPRLDDHDAATRAHFETDGRPRFPKLMARL